MHTVKHTTTTRLASEEIEALSQVEKMIAKVNESASDKYSNLVQVFIDTYAPVTRSPWRLVGSVYTVWIRGSVAFSRGNTIVDAVLELKVWTGRNTWLLNKGNLMIQRKHYEFEYKGRHLKVKESHISQFPSKP